MRRPRAHRRALGAGFGAGSQTARTVHRARTVANGAPAVRPVDHGSGAAVGATFGLAGSAPVRVRLVGRARSVDAWAGQLAHRPCWVEHLRKSVGERVLLRVKKRLGAAAPCKWPPLQ